MANISQDQIKEMAQLAGLELDDLRAETISLRLGAVLAELDEIPADALAEVEPSPVFTADVEERA